MAATGTRAAAGHPLDPLSADEIRQAVAILRRDRGVGPRWRFGSIELREPAKQAVRAFSPATRSSARPTSCAGTATTAGPTRRASRSPATACCPGSTGPGEQPNFTDGRVPRVQRGAASSDPRRDRGARAPRHHRHRPRAHRHLGLRRRCSCPRSYRGRRVGWTDVWICDEAGSNPYAQPDQRAALRRRHQHDGAARDRGRRRRPTGRGRWASTCRGSCPASALRDDLKPLEIIAARGRLVHPRRQPRCAGSAGRCGSASTRARAS